MKTLIIIDPQNDFMPGGPLAVPDGDAIIPVINRMQDRFDLVVATQDWHPVTHESFAANHSGKQPFEQISLHGIEQTLWPVHCVQGTLGAEFHRDLNQRPVAAIFRKGMNPALDSYSGFYNNDHTTSTGLAGYLREMGAGKLYFSGLCADICVYFTIKDALREGFECCLIEDATCPLNEDHYQVIKTELLAKGVDFVESISV